MKRRHLPHLTLLLVGVGALQLILYFYQPSKKLGHYTYVDEDHPRTLPVRTRGQVVTFMQDTVHYQLSGPTAQAEWDSLSPQMGIVRLGPEKRPFMVSVFHQLRCLDVIRRRIPLAPSGGTSANNSSNDRELRHCMNYIRQMVMCRASSRLEPATGLYLQHNVLSAQDYICEDWRPVYAAMRSDSDLL